MVHTVRSTDDRRAQAISVGGFLIQLATALALAVVARFSSSTVIGASARVALAGVPIWIVLYLIFKQKHRVRLETLETAELRRARESGSGSALFDVESEDLLLERAKLRSLERWMLPGLTAAVSLLLIAGYFIGWGWDVSKAFDPGYLARTVNNTVWVWFAVGAGFLCFLFARYTLALSRLPDWELLHAGACFLAGTAMMCLLVVIALFAGPSLPWVEPLTACAIRIGTLVLGIELAVNFMLDFYRPRLPGETLRPSFDSRLLGLITEPGSIAKSIADAINYQFGFEVSSTWFYRLMQRWILPLVAGTAFVVVLLSSIVVVDADEQVVVERFGQAPNAILSPGLHLKAPYPIDIVHRAPVKRINELVLGEALEQETEAQAKEPLIWTKPHEFVKELMLVVASRESTQGPSGAAPPTDDTRSSVAKGVSANLIVVSVPIQYRIRDIKAFLYNYEDPVRLMEGAAYRFLSDYASGVDMAELMGPGRERFNRDLHRGIQEQLDGLETGVEVVFVGLVAAHPPPDNDVAKSFQGVVTAQIRKTTLVSDAQGRLGQILTSVGGSTTRSLALDEAIRKRDELAAQPQANPAALQTARKEVEKLLLGSPADNIPPLSGTAAVQIAKAKADASDQIGEASVKAQAFAAEVAAYTAAPDLYRSRKWLDVYKQLGDIRKFLVLVDPERVIIELDTQQGGGLDEILLEEAGKQ